MATVVVLGYSCAGKSRILRDAQDRWPEVEALDSDKWLASPYGGHIYNIFFSVGREAALEMIAHREREFLGSLQPVVNPRLIAAGPILPAREPQWSAFCGRVGPRLVYLEQTPEEGLDSLRERRARHASEPGVGTHPLFGSWDEDVTTARLPDGTWADVDDDTAIANIRRQMAQLEEIYLRSAVDYRCSARKVREEPERDRFFEDLQHLLHAD
jgi:shikimate kinase